MLGVDIVEHSRIVQFQKDNNFLKKFLFSKELEQLEGITDKIAYISSRFAAKEAITKALKGKLLNYIYSDHLLILRSPNSSPHIAISNEFKEKMHETFGRNNIELSISHEKSLSIAIAILN